MTTLKKTIQKYNLCETPLLHTDGTLTVAYFDVESLPVPIEEVSETLRKKVGIVQDQVWIPTQLGLCVKQYKLHDTYYDSKTTNPRVDDGGILMSDFSLEIDIPTSKKSLDGSRVTGGRLNYFDTESLDEAYHIFWHTLKMAQPDTITSYNVTQDLKTLFNGQVQFSQCTNAIDKMIKMPRDILDPNNFFKLPTHPIVFDSLTTLADRKYSPRLWKDLDCRVKQARRDGTFERKETTKFDEILKCFHGNEKYKQTHTAFGDAHSLSKVMSLRFQLDGTKVPGFTSMPSFYRDARNVISRESIA